MAALISFLLAIVIAAFLIWWLNGKSFKINSTPTTKPPTTKPPTTKPPTQTSTTVTTTTAPAQIVPKKKAPPIDAQSSTLRKRAAQRQRW